MTLKADRLRKRIRVINTEVQIMLVNWNGRRFYMPLLEAEGGNGGNGGSGEGTGSGNGTGEGGQGNGDGGQGNGGQGSGNAHAGGQQGGEPFATFPDEKSFMARVQREGKKELQNTAKQMGYESVEQMQEAVKAYKKQQDDAKSDLDKAKDEAKTAKEEKDNALKSANDRLIRAEVKLKCADPKIGIVDDEAAFALMSKDDVKVNEDGTIEGVEDSLKDLVKKKAYLKGQNQGNIGSASNPGGGNGSQSDEEWGKEQAKKRSEKAQPAGGFNPWG
jgi:hypothetical protein